MTNDGRRGCKPGSLLTAFLLALAVMVSLTFGAKQATAAERVALIIGNSAYKKFGELKNPRNDAEAIAAMLSKFGFRVLKGIDVDQFNFRTLVRAFSDEIKDAKLALFYYAGHGLQVGRHNYLLPTDAKLAVESDLDFETVKLGFILQQMEREKRTNIILLDSCRDNPFAANLARNMGTRSASIGRGLAAVETSVGTYVGYATQPGNVALDGDTGNSPFTTAIVNHLAEPGLDIDVLMRRVREDVIKTTKGKQVPWSNSSLVGDNVVLNTTSRQIAVEPKLSAKPTENPTSPETAKIALELAYWNTIKDSKDPVLLNSYVKQFPNGVFNGLAKAMISQLHAGAATPTAAPTPTPAPTPALTQTPAQVVVATPTPVAPAKAPEPELQKLASLNPDASTSTVTTEVPQATLEPQDMFALSRDLQGELRRLGCIAARPDGIWGPQSRRALKKYAKYAKLALGSFEPTGDILNDMRTRPARICPLVCGARYNLTGGKCVRKTCKRGQILTRKGHCVAKRRTQTVTKKRRRKRQHVEEEIIIIEEPVRRRRKRNTFDNESDLCPRCDSL